MGRLEIHVKNSSAWLSEQMPIRVRDNEQKHVHTFRGLGPHILNVEPGLYSVEAVLEDGKIRRQFAHVAVNAVSKLEFKVRNIADGGPRAERIRGTESLTKRSDLKLEYVEGGKVSRMEHGWMFVPFETLQTVPHVRIATETNKYAISLPANPAAEFPLNCCSIEADSHGVGIRVGVSRQRSATNTMAQMIEMGHVEYVRDVAEESVEVLLANYSDAIGATFGGLLLRRLGQLQGHADWVQALADDFKWLTDGQILWSWLLSKSQHKKERAKGLRILLNAGRRRILFTEGLSLTLDLLRRWPDPQGVAERREILHWLAPSTGSTLWGETMLTQVVSRTVPQGDGGESGA